MATSMDWWEILNSHPILLKLKKYNDRFCCIADCKNWIAVRDGELFIWDPHNAAILVTNLKHILQSRSRSETETSDFSFQTLTSTKVPIQEVDSLIFSPSGNFLALVSKSEIIVVQLPQRWGKHGLYEGGKDRVLCKSSAVAERLLLGAGMKLLHAAWHPGSIDESHMTILTSDNYIRTYDIQQVVSPIESVCVCPDDDTFSMSTTAIQRALGDTVVAFDFGKSLEIQKNQPDLTGKKKSKRYWPLYVLCGNGDVYQILSCLDTKRLQKPCIQGPLAMHPPAEDNYGTDACAIMCIPGEPSILVLATLEAKLYHCVILETEREVEKSRLDDFLSTTSLYKEPSCAIYVYEMIQLNTSLTSATYQPNDSSDDPFSCLIRLQRDISQPDRYLCAHNAGLHAVVISWYNTIQDFSKTDDDEPLPKFTAELQAVVEHLVCTKPLPTSQAAPPLGTTIVTDKLLGTMLLCLTISLEIIVLPFRNNNSRGPPPSLLSSQPAKEIQSPMKLLHKEPFDEHIRMILKRSSTHPVIKTRKSTDLNPQECMQVLGQAVQVLREEYILKLDHVREETQKRVDLLREQKSQQEEDLLLCQQKKNILTEQAEALAEKYQDASDNQEEVVHRLETIFKKLYARMPMMTDAEKNMHKELKDMEERMEIFRSSIKQLDVKREYQTKHMKNVQQKQPVSTRSHLSKTQQQQLRTLLKNEGDEIADLVHQLSRIKTGVDK